MLTVNEDMTPLSEKIVPARGAAQRAAATLKEQTKKRSRKYLTSKHEDPSDEFGGLDVTEDDNDPIDDNTDVDTCQNRRHTTSSLGARRRGRGRGNGVRRRSSQKSTRTAPSSSFTSTGPVHSGSAVTPQKRSRPSTSVPSTRIKTTTFPRQSLASGEPSAASSLLAASPSGRSQSKYENIYFENDVIWARLDSRGTLVVPPALVDELSYWWPAQVTGDDPLDVSAILFGDDGHGRERRISIPSPNSSTVLPFRDAGRVRFSPSTFSLPDKHTQATGKFGIKVPSDLAERWTDARDQALEADVNDELPEAPSLINMLSVARKGKKTDEVHASISPISTPTRPKKPAPAPLDQEIKVDEMDGELVLASDHNGRPDHWPGRVVGVHQNKRTGKWLYEVAYMDGKKKKMERHRFFTFDEDGFATCQLGQWRTEFPASDTEGSDSEDEVRERHYTKSLSPSPSNSDLEDITDRGAFCDLSVKEQMRYVYPFLCRVIRRDYELSNARHDLFMKGGKARQELGHAASLRGQFSENEVKKVSLLVRRTMLRDERWAERVQNDVCGVNEQDTILHDGSDGTKAESVAESMPAPPTDLDAAMALTELKSSDIMLDKPASFVSCVSDITSHRDIDQLNHPSSQTLMAGIDPDTHLVQSSFTVLDQSSDMELDSDEERRQPSLPHKANSQHHMTPEASALPLSNLSADEIPVPLVSRMRPRGCDGYENLSRSERGLYCADVLFREAVLQLHLLRDGRRKSAHLLTPEEENALYEQGQKLLSEGVHWVTQIVQMRQLAENSYKRRTKKKEAPIEFIGGTSTRPKTRKVS